MFKFNEEDLIDGTDLIHEDNYISNMHLVLEKQYVDVSNANLISIKDYAAKTKAVVIPDDASLKKFLVDCPSHELKPTENRNIKCDIFTANGNNILLDRHYYKELKKIPHIKFLSDGDPVHQVYLVIQAGLMKKVIGCVMPCV